MRRNGHRCRATAEILSLRLLPLTSLFLTLRIVFYKFTCFLPRRASNFLRDRKILSDCYDGNDNNLEIREGGEANESEEMIKQTQEEIMHARACVIVKIKYYAGNERLIFSGSRGIAFVTHSSYQPAR